MNRIEDTIDGNQRLESKCPISTSHSRSNSSRRPDKSSRFQWNVSVVFIGDEKSVYQTLVSHHGEVVFHAEYELESVAAVAADLTKFVVKGASAFRRMNFQKEDETEHFPIDLNRVKRVLCTELTRSGMSLKEARSKSDFELTRVVDDVRHSIQLFQKELTETEVKAVSSRLAILETELSTEPSTALSHDVIDANDCLIFDENPLQNSEIVEVRENDISFKDVIHEQPTRMSHESPGDFSSRSESSIDIFGTSSEQPNSPYSSDQLSFDPVLKDRNQSPVLLSPAPDRASCKGVVPREEIELLLSLHERNPDILSIQASCCLENLQLIFIRQQSLLQLIQLDQILMNQGWSLTEFGVCLFKGIVVLCAHLDHWKLRKVVAFHRKSMMLQLEDGDKLSPLEVSNLDVLKTSTQSDYLIQEYNYHIEASNLQPLVMKEVMSVYHRLLCAGHVFKQLIIGSDDMKLIIQQFAQELVNPMSVEFESSLRDFVVPFSHSDKRQKSEIHQKMMTIVGSQLKNVFKIWLDTKNQSCNLSLTEELGAFLNALPKPPKKTPFQSRFSVPSRTTRDPRVTLSRQKQERNWPLMSSDKGVESLQEKPYSEVEVRGSVKIGRLNQLSQSLMRSVKPAEDLSYVSLQEIERALFRVGRDLHY